MNIKQIMNLQFSDDEYDVVIMINQSTFTRDTHVEPRILPNSMGRRVPHGSVSARLSLARMMHAPVQQHNDTYPEAGRQQTDRQRDRQGIHAQTRRHLMVVGIVFPRLSNCSDDHDESGIETMTKEALGQDRTGRVEFRDGGKGRICRVRDDVRGYGGGWTWIGIGY